VQLDWLADRYPTSSPADRGSALHGVPWRWSQDADCWTNLAGSVQVRTNCDPGCGVARRHAYHRVFAPTNQEEGWRWRTGVVMTKPGRTDRHAGRGDERPQSSSTEFLGHVNLFTDGYIAAALGSANRGGGTEHAEARNRNGATCVRMNIEIERVAADAGCAPAEPRLRHRPRPSRISSKGAASRAPSRAITGPLPRLKLVQGDSVFIRAGASTFPERIH